MRGGDSAAKRIEGASLNETPATEDDGTMDHFTIEGVLRMSLELSLGISIKLFCDNGRIHWRDFANDLLFWIPGVQRLASDGLTRQVESMIPPMAVHADEATPMAFAAK